MAMTFTPPNLASVKVNGFFPQATNQVFTRVTKVAETIKMDIASIEVLL